MKGNVVALHVYQNGSCLKWAVARYSSLIIPFHDKAYSSILSTIGVFHVKTMHLIGKII